MSRRRIRRLFRLPLHRSELVEDEVSDEIRLHLELRAEQLIRRGMPADEAWSAARMKFGEVEAIERQLNRRQIRRQRRMRVREWLYTVVQDGAYAVRALKRQAGFTGAAVLTLALGIGATTAIFSLVDAAMLARFPFGEADRLRIIWGVAGPERDRRGASYPEIADWQDMTQSFEAIVAYDATAVNVTGAGSAVQLQAELVSSAYFGLLGAAVGRGRGFRAEDDRSGAPPVVILSDRLWRGRFGADPDIIGRRLAVDGTDATVIGVAEPGFTGLSFDADIWSTWGPLVPSAVLESRGSRWLVGIAKLREGVTDVAASSDLEAAAVRLETLYPDVNADRRAELLSLREYYLDDTRTLLLVLLGAVAFLLLIACANVANLQVVRGLARSREIAVRNALGAGRGRIVRQLVTEAAVLALLGGAAGILLAHWALRALLPLVPVGVLPAYADVSLNPDVLLFSCALVLLSTLLAGLVPALRAAHPQFGAVLRESRGGTAGSRQARGQRAVVAAEMALAMALLVGAGLMIRSLGEQLRVDPGFAAELTLVGRVGLGDPVRYATPDARVRFAESLARDLGGIAGVEAVAVGSAAPLRGYSSAGWIHRDEDAEQRIRFYRHSVSPSFFSTLRIPIVQGREFGPADQGQAPAAVIVSESFAARVWPGEDAVGRRLRLGSESGRVVEVVGVAGDVHFRDLTTDLLTGDDDPDVYFPYAQAPSGSIDVIVRSRTPIDATRIRDAVAALDVEAPLYDVELLESTLSEQTATARFGSFLLGSFALLALLLAAVGLYGVITFLVNARRRDIAVRMALGAERGRILRLVMMQGMVVVIGGMLAGAVAGMAATRFLTSFLHGVRPADGRTLIVGTAVLLMTAGLATFIPALRAARTHPERVLRSE